MWLQPKHQSKCRVDGGAYLPFQLLRSLRQEDHSDLDAVPQDDLKVAWAAVLSNKQNR